MCSAVAVSRLQNAMKVHQVIGTGGLTGAM
jgi:hypothetical protein